MKKLLSAQKAVDLIHNGDTIATVGFSLVGAADTILREIESRFIEKNSPRDLRKSVV